MDWVIGIAIGAAVIIVAALWTTWNWYQNRGKLIAATALEERRLRLEAINYFAEDGWRITHDTEDFVIMEKGASAMVALVLLAVFLPVGLVYLLTDWGKGKLGIAFRQTKRGRGTEFQITWSNAAVRGRVRSFVGWAEQEAA